MVNIVPASGRTNVVAAFNELEPPLQSTVLFIIDCDGHVDPALKGHANLVITTNRDVEADLLFELRALHRLAHEYLSPLVQTPGQVDSLAKAVLDDACTVATSIGMAQSAALTLGLRTRLPARNGSRRKLRLTDLSVIRERLQIDELPSTRTIVDELGTLIGWTSSEADAVMADVAHLGDTPCVGHRQPGCDMCDRRQFCRGHYLIDAVALVLDVRHGVTLQGSAVASVVRVSADLSRMSGWTVAQRIKRWEATTGLQVLE
jgi:hypothetical protein